MNVHHRFQPPHSNCMTSRTCWSLHMTNSLIRVHHRGIFNKLPLDALRAVIFHFIKGKSLVRRDYRTLHAITASIEQFDRHNTLLGTIRHQLADLKRAVRGLVIVTSELEETSQALLQGKVRGDGPRLSALKEVGPFLTEYVRQIHTSRVTIGT